MQRPLVIIIGERRCGTTSLYRMLRAHPDVRMHPQPDFNYFLDEDTVNSRVWREGHADPACWEAAHDEPAFWDTFGEGAERYLGQKGADLFFMHEAHERIHRFAPDARLIVLLRNPVRRAWSQYWNERGKGRETRGFEKAIEEEAPLIAAHDYARDHLSYFHRGLYWASYQKLLQAVEPDQVHLVVMEQLYRDPEPEMQGVLAFLGLPSNADCTLPPRKKNQNWTLVDKVGWTRGARGWGYRQYKRVCERIIRAVATDTERRRGIRRVVYRPFVLPADGMEMADETRERLAARYVEDSEAMGAHLGIDLVKLWHLS